MSKNVELVKTCPLCKSSVLVYKFVVDGRVLCNCNDCSHLFVNPQPVSLFPQDEYFFDTNDFKSFVNLEINADGEHKLRSLEIGGSLLDNDCFEATNIACINELVCEKGYDLCILNNSLDYSNDPDKLLKDVHERLKKNGLLLFYLPVLDSKAGKKLRQKWPVFSGNRLHFFSTATIQNVLCKCGYEQIKIKPADDNGIFVSCRAGILRDERIISIIIPVYNEEKTVGALLDNVMNKRLEGLKKEIIVIESNSTDSTIKIVEEFVKEHPDVKLILEERPRGKGHAVRKGFKEATGDFIAIQDGDLEYDINDYDQLVSPLSNYQKAFVLGSRHSGDWKIRNFGKDEKIRAIYVNFGHILLTNLINLGCGVRLKDPFTMYKLFRRECLYGLEFDGNRFEIDWEIVIKLIKKGYIPVEIPINYSSRGFKDGKKISIILDPLICVISFVRYRYFYKMGNKE